MKEEPYIGNEYRMLEKGEKVIQGDFFFDRRSKTWYLSFHGDPEHRMKGVQSPDIIYKRKVE